MLAGKKKHANKPVNDNEACHTHTVANSLCADNYPSAGRWPTEFSNAICPQRVMPTVGGEHSHNDYIKLPTEKAVANMLATEESLYMCDGLNPCYRKSKLL